MKFLRESGEIFRIMSGKHEIITVQQNFKLGKFEMFSVNVTEKLRVYSKFPEEGNFIGQKCLQGPCVFYGLFEWKESAGHVLCKIK